MRLGPPEELESAGFADYCTFMERGSFVDFTFYDAGPQRAGRPVCRVVMSTFWLVDVVWTSSEAFLQEEQARLAEVGRVPIALVEAEPPPGVPGVPASVVRLFRTGPEGLFEFFYISPRSVFEAQGGRSQPIAIPKVCVSAPAELLVGFLKYLESRLGAFREALSLGQSDRSP